MPLHIVQEASILIIDNELANTRLLEIILQSHGCTRVCSVNDSRLALETFRQIQPDIVLLDLAMPFVDGFTLMSQIRQERDLCDVPILVLTADGTSEALHRSLSDGANDFLAKPFDATEVYLRVSNLALTRFSSELLKRLVLDRTKELELSQLETVHRLALAAEYRDDVTGLHTMRVGELCAGIAENLNWSVESVDLIRTAAQLHDIGKIGIPDSILLKPGKLTAEEFDVMKTHTIIGSKILSGSSSAVLKLADQIALYHHERWDGHGYARIPSSDVPLSARITMVADVFDALTHDRPYKQSWTVEDARQEIRSQSGISFDPQVVTAFEALMSSGYQFSQP